MTIYGVLPFSRYTIMIRAVPTRPEARKGMEAAESSEIEVKGGANAMAIFFVRPKAAQVELILSAGDHPSKPSNIEDKRDGSG